jgi:CBS domain-containing protein
MSNFAMPVELYMSSPVHTTRPDAPLEEAQEQIQSRRVSSLAVVDDDGAPVGVISRTDLIRLGRVQAGRRPKSSLLTLPSARTVGEVMAKGTVTVAPNDTIRQAATEMVEQRIHRVFVVDGGKLRGVLSVKDVMVAISNEKMRKPIDAFMSSPLFTIRASEPVSLGAERLERAKVSGVVVVDDDWPVGVFTQVESLMAKDLPRDTPIEEVMSPALLCMNRETHVHRAAAQAAATSVRRARAVL